ncbi:MAG TPA: sigma-70 family RNA polymerase sigma factor [Flavisolibacter sp.]|nr:sigma-70 family RNA polymerase sigma factor [Flavisolibacter sp.]
MDKLFAHSIVDSEQEIIAKICSGERALFEVLIRRYNPVLYKIARGYGFGHHDAEDLLQETHVAAYLNLSAFEGRASYKTWIAKIMVHKCLYKLSHGPARKEASLDNEIHENATPMFTPMSNANENRNVIRREFSRILENSLQHIPLSYRTVFILREVEGFNTADTADLLNITPMNVKVRLNRAKSMLQKLLEGHYSSSDLYEFNLIYCDAIVNNVFKKINEHRNGH